MKTLHCLASWRLIICDETLRHRHVYASLLQGLCFLCVTVLSPPILSEISPSSHHWQLSCQLLKCCDFRRKQMWVCWEEGEQFYVGGDLESYDTERTIEMRASIIARSSQFSKHELHCNLNYFLLKCYPVLHEEFNQYSVNTPYKLRCVNHTAFQVKSILAFSLA